MKKNELLVVLFAVCSTWAIQAQSKDVSINYESWTPYKDTMEEIVGDLKKTNPTISVEIKMYANYTEFVNSARVSFAAKVGPDVFAFDSPTSLALQKALIEPLDSYAEKEWGKDWRKRFLSSALTDCSLDGKLMGLPMGSMPGGLIWYNKTMFTKFGIKVPQNYADLKKAADTLRKNNMQPLLLGGKDAWIVIDTFQTVLNDFAPGKQYLAYAKKSKFTDPAIIKAFEFWKKMYDDKIIQDQSFSMTAYMDCYNAMIDKQNAGMWSNGAWNLDIFGNADLKDKVNAVEWGVMPFPDLNGDGKIPPTMSTVGGFCISKDSKNKEAAWQLLKSMGTGTGMRLQTERFLWTPPLTISVPVNTSLSQNASDLRNSIANIVSTTPPVYRGIPNAKVADKMYDVLNKVALGVMKPDAAAAEVQKVIDAN